MGSGIIKAQRKALLPGPRLGTEREREQSVMSSEGGASRGEQLWPFNTEPTKRKPELGRREAGSVCRHPSVGVLFLNTCFYRLRIDLYVVL